MSAPNFPPDFIKGVANFDFDGNLVRGAKNFGQGFKNFVNGMHTKIEQAFSRDFGHGHGSSMKVEVKTIPFHKHGTIDDIEELDDDISEDESEEVM